MSQSGFARKLNTIGRMLMRHAISIALAITISTIWGLIAVSTVIQERRLLEVNTRELTQLNNVVTQHSYALFNTIETDLRTLDLALHWQTGIDPLTDQHFIALVDEYRRASDGVLDVGAISADGMLYLLPTPTRKPSAYVADREVVIAAMTPTMRPFTIGLPIIGRVNGRWGIPVSWRLSAPVGRIVALEVFVELDRLIALHDEFRVKPEGTIDILRLDGYMLSRTPFDARLVGHSFKGNPVFDDELARKQKGTLITSGQATDGVERITSYERLNGYPLIVVVTRGVHEVLANFYLRVFLLATVAAVATLVLIAFAIAFRKSLRALHVVQNERNQSLIEQQAILDNAMTGIAFLKHRVIQRCNLGYEKMFGYGPGEMIGLSTRVLYESEEEYSSRWGKLIQLLDGGEVISGDRQYLHKDGHLIWCNTYIKLIDEHDPESGMVIVMQEITARKEIEQALEQANHKLAELSVTDGLTGLANRRRFDEIMQREWRRALRTQEPLALAMIDIDNFKAYNDHYGHLAGDQCLRAVAQALAAGLRDGVDFIARYGGEEFVIILPGENAQTAYDVLDRLRRDVAALAIPHVGNNGSAIVTFSAGLAITVPRQDATMDALIGQADENLYHAKRSGRNQVYWVYPLPGAKEQKDE